MATALISALSTPWGFLSVLVVALVLLIAIIVLAKSGKVTLKDILFMFGKKVPEEPKEEEKVELDCSPHYACPHAHDILDIAKRTAELGDRRFTIKADVFNEQQKYSDEKLDECANLVERQVIRLIAIKTNSDIPFMQHPDYAIFQLIKRAIVPQIKAYMEYRFKENHYATYTLDGQRDYIDERVRTVNRMVSEALNVYWCCKEISRDEIYEKNKDEKEKHYEILCDIFDMAFTLAREGQAKIELVEASYQNFMEGLIAKPKVEDLLETIQGVR